MTRDGARIESGGTRIARPHVRRLHRQAGRTGPLMMAKERKKKGKGKAGRVDLIERYGREGNAEDLFPEARLMTSYQKSLQSATCAMVIFTQNGICTCSVLTAVRMYDTTLSCWSAVKQQWQMFLLCLDDRLLTLAIIELLLPRLVRSM